MMEIEFTEEEAEAINRKLSLFSAVAEDAVHRGNGNNSPPEIT